MTRRIACLVAFAAFATALTGTADLRAAEPRAEEPSIKGTWIGYLNVAGNKVKFTTTIEADGTYKVVMDHLGYIVAEKGKYTYSDGVLETEPDGGANGTFTVKFEDKNTMIVKGGGITITYKRQ